MFDIDQFLEACLACLSETEPRRAIREVLSRAVARPSDVATAFGRDSAGISLLYHSPRLTVIDVVWAPRMNVFAHDHRVWAAIAVYGGREDNSFFRRAMDGKAGLSPSNGKTLVAGDVVMLGDDVIHAVANPGSTPTGAIHVYGGDFVNQPRSQWRPPLLEEEPYDSSLVARVFADANAAWASSSDG